MATKKLRKLPGKTKPPTVPLRRGKHQSMETKAGARKPARATTET